MHQYLVIQNCLILFRFRSEENGNCLFLAFSIVMSGDKRYVDDLRILVSIELYLNSEFMQNIHVLRKTSIVTLVYLIMLTLC